MMFDEFPEDYLDEIEDIDDEEFLACLDEEIAYEVHRKQIAADIARYMKCPMDAVTDEQINEWESRGWSISDGEPYCLSCGMEIKSSLEKMPQRKLCGSCRSTLN
jgi:hypothetical protein